MIGTRDSLGEGIFLCSESMFLYWVDINHKKIFKKDLSKFASPIEEIRIKSNPSAIISVKKNKIIYLNNYGINELDFNSGNSYKVSHNPDLVRNSNKRSNDGVMLKDSRIIYGIMDFTPEDLSGSIYLYHNNCHHFIDHIGIPNLFIEHENRILISDSFNKIIYAYEINNFNNKEVWLDLSSQSFTPDGGCIGPDGNIYIAMWGGGFIAKYKDNGRLLDKIELKAKQPTNCVFGPKETIYITSASEGLSHDELEQFPDSGYLIEKKLKLK